VRMALDCRNAELKSEFCMSSVSECLLVSVLHSKLTMVVFE
jgi:hypothetical protein